MTLSLPARIPGVLSAEFESDPYASYGEMRGHAPLYYDGELQAYVLSRYADVDHAFKNPAVTNWNYEWQHRNLGRLRRTRRPWSPATA